MALMRTLMTLLLACTPILATSFGDAVARAKKPRVPAGVDPGGVSIAILSAGVDYRRADVSARLARDGEGELVGWDLVDGDNRPYLDASIDSHSAEASAIVAEVGAALPARFIPVRLDGAKNGAMREAMAFIEHTPAQIIVSAIPRQPLMLLITKQLATAEADIVNSGALQDLLADASPATRLAEILTAVRDCPTTTRAVNDHADQNLKQLKMLLNKDATPTRKRPLPLMCDKLSVLRSPIQ